MVKSLIKSVVGQATNGQPKLPTTFLSCPGGAGHGGSIPQTLGE